MTNENKLKTLKDLEEEAHPVMKRCYCHLLLKAEAIKWVKAHSIEMFKGYSYVEQLKFEGANDWIKHFFNLTGEELVK